MIIKNYIPCTQLQPYIRTYKIIESRDGMLSRVLPNTSLAVAFRIKGQTNYAGGHLPASVVTGLRKSVRLINYESDTATLVVMFKETGAASFFKTPANELFGESISLDHFIHPQEIALIEEQLEEAGTYRQKVAVIESFLLSCLRDHKTDGLVTAAVDIIYQSKGLMRIKELADQLFISNDAFEKRFRKVVGTSPKQFSYLVKMWSLIRQKDPDPNLADIAYNAGYFDQSHFNKDFKLFTGQTPGEFFKSVRFR